MGQKRKRESSTGLEPAISRFVGGCLIHWATRTARCIADPHNNTPAIPLSCNTNTRIPPQHAYHTPLRHACLHCARLGARCTNAHRCIRVNARGRQLLPMTTSASPTNTSTHSMDHCTTHTDENNSTARAARLVQHSNRKQTFACRMQSLCECCLPRVITSRCGEATRVQEVASCDPLA